MSGELGSVAALDVGESVRVAPPVWQDLQAFCDTQGVKVTSVPMDADRARLDAAAAELADASEIAVFACPDPYTRMARDLVAAVIGPAAVASMDVLLDKSRTRELCQRFGAQTPEGFSGAGRRIVDRAVDLLERTGQVVVKDPHGYAGMGVRTVDDRTALVRMLDDDEAVVVEEFVDGEEFSVEAVCGPAGLSFVGWMAKGRTDALVHPLNRVRYTPAEPVPAVLRAPCEQLLAASGYRGIVEVELVVENGRAYVLECNPRTSGVTATIYFTGRTSSLRRLVAGLLGVAVPAGTPTAAAEYGLSDPPVEPEPYRAQVYCHHPPADTEFDSRAYLWGDSGDLEQCLTRASPVKGAQFAKRGGAAAEVLALDVIRAGTGR